MESLRGRQSSPVNFIQDPQHAVDFYLVCRRKCPELAVAGQENAANVHFGECVSKAIMDRQPGTARDDLSRTEHLMTRQVHNLQPALEQHPLFASREAEQFVLKECVRDENLIRQTQKDPEQRGLLEVDETTAVTDDNPHQSPAVLSNRLPPRAGEFAAVQRPC